MSDYPRTKNGYVDDGHILAQSKGRKCPNCGSSAYRETVSREHCSSCGLTCDYWGSGSNDVYNEYLERKHARDEEQRRQEQIEWDKENSW